MSASRKMSARFANITNITLRTQEVLYVHHTRMQPARERVYSSVKKTLI